MLENPEEYWKTFFAGCLEKQAKFETDKDGFWTGATGSNGEWGWSDNKQLDMGFLKNNRFKSSLGDSGCAHVFERTNDNFELTSASCTMKMRYVCKQSYTI